MCLYLDMRIFTCTQRCVYIYICVFICLGGCAHVHIKIRVCVRMIFGYIRDDIVPLNSHACKAAWHEALGRQGQADARPDALAMEVMCTCVYRLTHAAMLLYRHIYTHIYIYMYVYIHTYIHTYIYI